MREPEPEWSNSSEEPSKTGSESHPTPGEWESLTQYFRAAGPAYEAHWKAWKNAEFIEPDFTDPDRLLQRLELEACAAAMFETVSPLLRGAAERMFDVVLSSAAKLARMHNFSLEEFEQRIMAAREEHARVFPHPAGMTYGRR